GCCTGRRARSGCRRRAAVPPPPARPRRAALGGAVPRTNSAMASCEGWRAVSPICVGAIAARPEVVQAAEAQGLDEPTLIGRPGKAYVKYVRDTFRHLKLEQQRLLQLVD
ncbi:MAG TPA: hypothetical protein VL652_36675, partial [Kutzneria sp.]|nr:hypothetical protein [Kutzneria sp.]